MKFSLKRSRLLGAFCTLFASVLIIGACTEVDDYLGQNLIPRNQQMDIFVETMNGEIFTHLYQEDSLVSNNIGYIYFGQESGPVFGHRKNSFIVQFLPTYIPSTTKGYGNLPIVDSLFWYLPISQVSGDTTQVQSFDVYKIYNANNNFFRPDSTFHTRFDITQPYFGESYLGEKLFEFSCSGRANLGVRLFPTAAGQTYMNSFIEMDLDDYLDDSLFRVAYQGLYVTPSLSSPATAATYGISTSDAYMMLCGRNHDTLDVTAIQDTIYGLFSFKEGTLVSGTKQSIFNTNINMVEFDYSGSTLGGLLSGMTAEPDKFFDTLETSATQPLMYVQPMGGVTGFLRFSNALVDEIQQLKFNKTDENGNPVTYDNIMVNQAHLYVWLEDDDTDMMNRSFERLGSYKSLRRVKGITDYAFSYEAYLREQSNSSDYLLPYNGYLDRSNGYYPLNITSYVQEIINATGNPDELLNTMHLGPDAFSFFGNRNSIMYGYNSSKPLQLKITYTLIKNND